MSSPSDQTSEPEKELFAPGEVFASRYRMITRIGRGAMGDVWRADDLVLETPVALKVIHSAGSDVRVRILHEVRLARQITHPAVCRVFDVGESEGAVFYSMELVRGESHTYLRELIGSDSLYSTSGGGGTPPSLSGGGGATHVPNSEHVKPTGHSLDEKHCGVPPVPASDDVESSPDGP